MPARAKISPPVAPPRSTLERERRAYLTEVGFAFFNEISIVEQLSRNVFERILPDGLSASGFDVLNYFVRHDFETQSPVQLARCHQVTKGAMTNILKRLEAQGLVTLEPDLQDARGKIVRLTAAGRATRDDCVARLAPKFEELFSEFDPEELAALIPSLVRLRTFLDERR